MEKGLRILGTISNIIISISSAEIKKTTTTDREIYRYGRDVNRIVSGFSVISLFHELWYSLE